MDATIFTGWIDDHLLPHAEQVKVAHPLMLHAIAAAKKKKDRIDAGKIADCLRCDFLPEMGEVSRFPSIREAISYCGLCGDEKSSADKVMRAPFPNNATSISNACWWKPRSCRPRQDYQLATAYEREKQKRNANRATLAVARKMVAYLLAVDWGQRDFVSFADPRSAAA